MKRYENFVGLTEVKAAQGKVVQMEKAFVETQDLRRELQMKVRIVDYLISRLWRNLVQGTKFSSSTHFLELELNYYVSSNFSQISL